MRSYLTGSVVFHKGPDNPLTKHESDWCLQRVSRYVCEVRHWRLQIKKCTLSAHVCVDRVWCFMSKIANYFSEDFGMQNCISFLGAALSNGSSFEVGLTRQNLDLKRMRAGNWLNRYIIPLGEIYLVRFFLSISEKIYCLYNSRVKLFQN